MKRFLFFILLIGILPISGFSQDKKQVAILEPIAMTKEVSTMHRSMVRGEMVKAISNQSGYAAFTRTDIDQIMKEQNFQQSGMVDDATRKRLGAMQGVDYVCVTKITKEGNNYYLEANLVNIETGKISNPATQYGELDGGSLSNMLVACEKLAAELVGRKVQYTSSYSRPSYSYSSSPKLSSDEEFSLTTGSSSGESSSSSSSVNHRTIPQGYVDLGLPSKTLWKDKNEGGNFHTYEEAVGRFGNKLPTKQQLEELKNRCIWTWTGNGYKVTGPNGNSITLPAAGYRFELGLVQNVGMCGYYWSSTTQHPGSAWHLYFSSIETSIKGHGNYNNGYSVRLVQN